MTAWAIGTTRPRKRIHRADCKYARHPYHWAADKSEAELLVALIESGAFSWHDAGQCCSYDLDAALRAARCDVALNDSSVDRVFRTSAYLRGLVSK